MRAPFPLGVARYRDARVDRDRRRARSLPRWIIRHRDAAHGRAHAPLRVGAGGRHRLARDPRCRRDGVVRGARARASARPAARAPPANRGSAATARGLRMPRVGSGADLLHAGRAGSLLGDRAARVRRARPARGRASAAPARSPHERDVPRVSPIDRWRDRSPAGAQRAARDPRLARAGRAGLRPVPPLGWRERLPRRVPGTLTRAARRTRPARAATRVRVRPSGRGRSDDAAGATRADGIPARHEPLHRLQLLPRGVPGTQRHDSRGRLAAGEFARDGELSRRRAAPPLDRVQPLRAPGLPGGLSQGCDPQERCERNRHDRHGPVQWLRALHRRMSLRRTAAGARKRRGEQVRLLRGPPAEADSHRCVSRPASVARSTSVPSTNSRSSRRAARCTGRSRAFRIPTGRGPRSGSC